MVIYEPLPCANNTLSPYFVEIQMDPTKLFRHHINLARLI